MYKKIFIIFLSLLLIILSSSPVMADSYTSESKINDLAEKIEFIVTEGFSYDENGNLAQINFDKIEEKYGYNADLEDLKNDLEQSRFKRGNRNHCCGRRTMQNYGFNIAATISPEELTELLTNRSFTEIAERILSSDVGAIGLADIVAELAKISKAIEPKGRGGYFGFGYDTCPFILQEEQEDISLNEIQKNAVGTWRNCLHFHRFMHNYLFNDFKMNR